MLEGVAGYRLRNVSASVSGLFGEMPNFSSGVARLASSLAGQASVLPHSTPQFPKKLLSLHCCGCAWIAAWLLAWVYSSLISLLNCINWRSSSRVGTPPAEAGGTGTGASRPGCRAPAVRRWFLDDDVKARVARQRHHEVLIERQAV